MRLTDCEKSALAALAPYYPKWLPIEDWSVSPVTRWSLFRKGYIGQRDNANPYSARITKAGRAALNEGKE